MRLLFDRWVSIVRKRTSDVSSSGNASSKRWASEGPLSRRQKPAQLTEVAYLEQRAKDRITHRQQLGFTNITIRNLLHPYARSLRAESWLRIG